MSFVFVCWEISEVQISWVGRPRTTKNIQPHPKKTDCEFHKHCQLSNSAQLSREGWQINCWTHLNQHNQRSCDKILISFRTHFVLNCPTSRSMLLKDATTAVLSRNNSLCLCLLYSAKWLIYWCKRDNNKAELPITGRYINTEYMVSNVITDILMQNIWF